MSEFIGESTILVRADARAYLFAVLKAIGTAERKHTNLIVKADTKLFRSQVREVAAETNKFVKATIIVQADTRAFKFGVKRAVAEAEKTPVALLVGADTKAFQANLRTTAERSKRGVVASIPMRVDPKGFRAALFEAVKRAEKGVVARVGVVAGPTRVAAPVQPAPVVAPAPAHVTPAAVTAPVATTAGETSADQIIADRKKIEQEFVNLHAKAIRENEALDRKAATEMNRIHAAALQENKRLDAEAFAARQQAIGPTAHGAAIEEDKQRNILTKQTALSLQKQAAAQLRLTEVAKGSIAAESRLATVKQIQIDATAGVTAAEKALQAARLTNNQTLIDEATRQLDVAKATRDRTTSGTSDIKKISQAEAKLAQSTKLSILAQQEIVGAKNEEAAANKRLELTTRSLTLAREAEAIASGVENAELRRLTVAKIREQAATATLATSDAASAARRVTANKSVRESILANTLSLLGLRGSALAANAAFLGTSAAIITIAKSVQLAAQLESQLNVFKVTAGATADEMKRVSAAAEQLGRDITLPGVGAGDAAQALTELSKAGLSVQDSIDGARGVLQLATAAQIDNAQATELVASALNAFGLAGTQAVKIADLLANAANDSQGSIVDMGTALSQSAAVARQAGLSVDQTVAALTLFARAGLTSSDAGTSFRTALLRLINPSKKAQAIIDKLGLSVRTSTGAINLNVFDEFAQKTRLLTNAQRDQALAIIFGQDAIRGAAILARAGKQGLDDQIVSLEKSGTAAQVAGARMAGLTGSAENLKNQLSALGTTIGTGLIPFLNTTASALAGLASGFTDAFQAADLLGNKLKDIGKLAFKVPQIKIGPIDTADFDKQTSGFAKRAAKFAPKVAFAAVSPGGFVLGQTVKQIENMRRLQGNTQGVREEVFKILQGLKGTNEVSAAISFTAVVGQLTELQKKLAGGNDNAQRLSGEIAQIISQLKTGTALPPFTFPKVTLPPDLRSGRPGKEAGDNVLAAFDAALPPSKVYDISFNAFSMLEKGIKDGVDAAVAAITTAVPNAIALVQALLRTGMNKTIKDAEKNIGKLGERALDIELAGGTPEQRIANLRREFAQQQRIIDATVGKTGKDIVAKRRAAKQRQVEINGEIQSIEEQRRTDAKSAADKVKQARDDADQAFLDSLEAGRTPFTRRLARAEETQGEQDNVNALLAMRKRIQREIDAVRTGVKDTKTKTQQLRKLSDELFQNGQDLRAARKRRNDAIVQALTDRGQAIQSLGETTDNTKLIIKGLDLQIKAARETLIKAKAAKIGVEAANAALEQLKKTRRETIQSARDTLLGEAFRLAEARGNKDLMVQIINLQIKEAQRALNLAKTAVARYKALADIQELINKRKEILTDSVAKGEQQGTTVFELLKQNAETFNANAGNLISGNQPFAGPAGFTADIAQFLIRQRTAGAAGGGRNLRTDTTPGSEDIFFRGTPAQRKQNDLTLQLIAALQKLTDATLSASDGKGNSSTASPTFGGVPQGSLADRFLDATRARKVRESRSGI